MIELKDDGLVFTFPEVHASARLGVAFQRTLRIPDDGKEHHLPPGLGRFPLRHVDDFAGRIPPDLGRARRRDVADVPGRGPVDPLPGGRPRWRRRLPVRRPRRDGQGRRRDGQDVEGRARTQAPELPVRARAAVARRVLRREGRDPPVRRDAARRGVHGRGAGHRQGPARRPPARRPPHEGRGLRAAAQGAGATRGAILHGQGVRVRRVRRRDGAGPGREDAAAAPRGPLPARGLGPRAREPVLRPHRELDGLAVDHRRAAARAAPHRGALHAGRPAVVRRLRGGREGAAGSKVLRGLKSVAQLGKKKGDVPLPENESVSGETVVDLRKGLRKHQVREGAV